MIRISIPGCEDTSGRRPHALDLEQLVRGYYLHIRSYIRQLQGVSRSEGYARRQLYDFVSLASREFAPRVRACGFTQQAWRDAVRAAQHGFLGQQLGILSLECAAAAGWDWQQFDDNMLGLHVLPHLQPGGR